ncbi:hypothetical protein Tco_0243161 [Tanacetum coccineum]
MQWRRTCSESVEICWDAEAEGILADVECTPPYDQPQALTTTNMFQANHEDAYDSDVDEGPNAAIAFMANLSSTSAANSQVNEYLLDTEAQNVPTEVSADTSDKVSMIAILTDLQTQLDGHAKVNQEKLSPAKRYVQRLTMPTIETIPMLSKKPKRATKDLHKDILVVSMKKMNEKPGHVRPANGFYEKLNALKFVPQQELSREQAYWLPANERASQTSNPNRPIFDDLETEYEQCVLDNKNLTIEKKNLLIKNDCLIAECLEKDICSIVFTSDSVVPPSSNCLCEDIRSACDREHTKVLELEAEISKQKQLISESEKQQQLQGKTDTIRNLDAQITHHKVLTEGYHSEGSCDQQALETDRIQLKDTITSLRIQLDGLKVENVSLKKRFDELSKANTHSRTAHTENTKLKAQVTGTTSSGPSTIENTQRACSRKCTT